MTATVSAAVRTAHVVVVDAATAPREDFGGRTPHVSARDVGRWSWRGRGGRVPGCDWVGHCADWFEDAVGNVVWGLEG